MQRVVKGEPFSVNLEQQELQVMTDSVLGTEDKIFLNFLYPSNNKYFGDIQIMFVKMTYHIGWCSNGYDNEFDRPPTLTTPTIWRIALDRGSRILIWCNDELVLTYTFDSSSREECNGRYTPDVVKIRFTQRDTASFLYKIVELGKSQR